jgi:cation:H+ antiporter
LLVDLLITVVGVVLLVGGASTAVDRGRQLARRRGISELMVGLTITSIGTSLPELATSTSAAWRAHGELTEAAGVALGNLLGSNLFMLGGLLGASGLVAAFHVETRSLRRDGTALAVATALVLAMGVDGRVGRIDAAVLVVGFAAYMAVLVRGARAGDPVEITVEGSDRNDALLMLAGLAAVIIGAQLAVDRSIAIAAGLGVPGAVLGVWIGIGTSLPEFVVSLQAAWKGASELALGNVMGSAITNLTLCLGVAAMAGPLAVGPVVTGFDGPFLLVITAVALLLLSNHRDLSRAEGGVLLLLFGLFLFLRTVGGISL